MWNHLNPESTRVRAHGRLHFALVNLSPTGARINGGAGAMISPPAIQVCINQSAQLLVTPDNWTAEVLLVRQRLGIGSPANVMITLDQRMRWHVGLGFHTQLRLAIAAAFSFAFSLKIDPLDLPRVLSRGGTSGIGALGFWHGGIVFDGGKQRSSSRVAFEPSSVSACSDLAPLLFHRASLPFYPVVALGRGWDLVYGDVERRLFAELTPIPTHEAAECARTVYMDLQSAVAMADYDAFCEAISGLSLIGFKRREIAYRGDNAAQLLQLMTRSGLRGCGMSSWGPTCFGFARERAMASQAANLLRKSPSVEEAWVCEFAPGSTVSLDGGPELSAFQVARRLLSE